MGASARPALASPLPRAEAFSGTDATASTRFGYAGGVWALGHGLDAPGYRIRALGGYGIYAYDGSIPFSGGSIPVGFFGQVLLGEMLAGRMWRSGEWTFKAYGGVQYMRHAISPDDPANAVNGARWGAKGLIEIWRNLGSRNWLSADAAYGTAFGDYWTQARLGHRLNRRVSVGLEAGALGNGDYGAGRGGGFLRLHLGNAELTVSGGASGDYRNDASSGYVAVGFYRKR